MRLECMSRSSRDFSFPRVATIDYSLLVPRLLFLLLARSRPTAIAFEKWQCVCLCVSEREREREPSRIPFLEKTFVYTFSTYHPFIAILFNNNEIPDNPGFPSGKICTATVRWFFRGAAKLRAPPRLGCRLSTRGDTVCLGKINDRLSFA